ncbi:UNVERIFIED_ORG: hypothetical protein FHR35_007437 [Microbispora rosea subsp. rosea]
MGDRTSGALDLVAGARRLAVAALVIGLWGSVMPGAEAAPIRHGHGDGHGDGATQVTGGTNTSNSPTIKSPPKQISGGRRNVNAPAANSAVTFAGIQQVSSVSVFTNTLNGNCKRGINRCVINQNLRTVESRGGRR